MDALKRLAQLSWRWALRFMVGYVVLAASLLAAGLLMDPTQDFSEVGGSRYLVSGYIFWVLWALPVLAIVGVVEAVAVWAASETTRSIRASQVVAGLCAGVAALVVVAIFTAPRWADMAVFAVAAVCLGLLAAWIAGRDATRLQRTSSS